MQVKNKTTGGRSLGGAPSKVGSIQNPEVRTFRSRDVHKSHFNP